MRQSNVAEISPQYAFMLAASAAISAPRDEASRLFDRALAMPGIREWPFDVARLRLYYGEHLRRIGSRSDARLQLRAALDDFEQLGAHPWAARAGDALRAGGQPSLVNGAAATVELTADEYEIATLAASGLSNKEIGQKLFLSHRTVGARLYRIFPKLGITSRAALADALAQHPKAGHPATGAGPQQVAEASPLRVTVV
jgi:DNA-binding CsgD family transcriptional regulator